VLSTEVQFVGWFRASRSAPWQRFSEGATYGDAWGALLDRLPTESGPGGESCILPVGRDPAETATRQPEHRGR
jgi:hypothetical protein